MSSSEWQTADEAIMEILIGSGEAREAFDREVERLVAHNRERAPETEADV